MKRLIVTGISTDVGKSVVSAIITQMLNAAYWKPIEAGGSDTAMVSSLTGAEVFPPAYQLTHPLSPHHAAHLQGIELDPKKIKIPQTDGPLIIEGSGGVLTPLNQNTTIGECFAKWKLPWVIVSKHYLGSLNHTLLTIEWLRTHGQIPLGIIFNGTPYPEGESWLLSKTELPSLGNLKPEPQITKRTIQWYAKQFHPLWKEI